MLFSMNLMLLHVALINNKMLFRYLNYLENKDWNMKSWVKAFAGYIQALGEFIIRPIAKNKLINKI